MSNMANEIKLENTEKLQIENIILKMEVASKEIDIQQKIIDNWNRTLSMTISVLRTKYGLGPSWKLDTKEFKLVDTTPPKEELIKFESKQKETEPGE